MDFPQIGFRFCLSPRLYTDRSTGSFGEIRFCLHPKVCIRLDPLVVSSKSEPGIPGIPTKTPGEMPEICTKMRKFGYQNAQNRPLTCEGNAKQQPLKCAKSATRMRQTGYERCEKLPLKCKKSATEMRRRCQKSATESDETEPEPALEPELEPSLGLSRA